MKEETPISKTIQKKTVVKLNRRVITFLICLLISVFFWLLMSLSKEYEEVISFPVRYENMPSDKVVANELPQSMDVEVKAKGFFLLRYQLFPEREVLVLDMKDARPTLQRNHYYLDPDARLDKIISQFQGRVKINRISPDTIFLNFNKRVKKTVPVKAALQLSFAPQYQLSDSVMVEPKEVVVSGAADVLEKIHDVPTMPLQLKDLKASVSVKLDLLNFRQEGGVEYSVDNVIVKLKVVKYTEGSLELPVEVEHLPPGFSLKTFPDKVTVRYNVAFENYEKIDPSKFMVAVDYSKITPGSNKLKLQLIKAPQEVRNIKLETEKVEFIIRK